MCYRLTAEGIFGYTIQYFLLYNIFLTFRIMAFNISHTKVTTIHTIFGLSAHKGNVKRHRQFLPTTPQSQSFHTGSTNIMRGPNFDLVSDLNTKICEVGLFNKPCIVLPVLQKRTTNVTEYICIRCV